MRRKEKIETRTQQPSATQPVTAARAMAAWAPAADSLPLTTLDEVGSAISRLLGSLTVPRILLATVVALAVLVPWAVHNRRDDVRLLEAGRLYDAHRWDEAGAIFASLRPSLLDQPEVSLQYARCLLETEQGAEAIASLERARSRIGAAAPAVRRTLDVELPALSAWAQVETGHAEAGAAALRDILKKNPQHLTANLALGRYALQAGLMQEAAKCYNVLAHSEETAYALAEFQSATGKIAAAIPAAQLAKLPEQVTQAPEPAARATPPANPATLPGARTPEEPAQAAAPLPAATALTSPTAP